MTRKLRSSVARKTLAGASCPAAAAILVLTVQAPSARAADGFWTRNADGNWSDPSAWQGGVVPGMTGDRAFFQASTTAPRTITLDAPQTVGGLFLQSNDGYTLGGTNLLTVATATGSANISASSDSANRILAPVLLASPTTVDNTRYGVLTFAGPISGSADLRFTGMVTAPHSTVLDADNTFTGPITVSGGRLTAARSAALGPAPRVTASGGILNLAAPVTFDSLTVNGGTVEGAGAVSIRGGGTVDLRSGTMIVPFAGPLDIVKSSTSGAVLYLPAFSYNPDVTVRRGALTLVANKFPHANTHRVSVDGASGATLLVCGGGLHADIRLNNAVGLSGVGGLSGAVFNGFQPATVHGAVDLGDTGSVIGGADMTLAGPVTGGALVKVGYGELFLTHERLDYAGPTTVGTDSSAISTSARMTLTAAARLNNTPSVTVHHGATLTVGGLAGGDRIPDATPVILRGGALTLRGAATAGATESLRVEIPLGTAHVTVAAGGTDHATALTVNALDRAPGAALRVLADANSGPLGGDGAADPRILFTAPPPVVNGIVGAWAVYQPSGSTSAAAPDFLTYDPARGLKPLGPDNRPASPAAAGPQDNVLLPATAPDVTLDADATVNSITFPRRDTPDAIWIADGRTLNVVSGGLLTSKTFSGSAPHTRLRGGRLTAGGNSTAAAELHLNGYFDVSSDIVDNPAGGRVSVVAPGPYSVTLSGHNTYSGATVVNDNALVVTTPGALPATTDLYADSGTVLLDATATFEVASLTVRQRARVDSRNAQTPRLNAHAYHLESGSILVELAGSGAMTKSGPRSVEVTRSSPGYSGPVTVDEGDLRATYADSLGTGPLTINGGRLSFSFDGTVTNALTLAGGELNAAFLPKTFSGPITASRDSVITAPATAHVTLTGPLHLGTGVTLTKSGDAALTLAGAVTAADNTSLHVAAGSLVVNTGLDPAPPAPAAIGAPRLAISAAANAAVTFNAPQRLRALALSGSATATLAAPAGGPNTLVTSALTITGTASLDLATNGLAVTYFPSDPSPIADVRAKVLAGAIRSSAAAPNTALGYAEASDLAPDGGAVDFLGQSVPGPAVLVRLTLLGDATLDGAVDFDDLTALAQNYHTTVSAVTDSWWARGDFTGDGVVDFADLTRLAQNYRASLPAPAFDAPPGFDGDLARAFATVPEPGPLSFLPLAAWGLAAQRRRRRRPGSRSSARPRPAQCVIA